jgi:hypothetical protein
MMNSSSSMGHQALADFFGSMVTQKAHWYNLVDASNSDPSSAELSKIFPSLLGIWAEKIFASVRYCGTILNSVFYAVQYFGI